MTTPIVAVPTMTAIPHFPPLSERAAGTYNNSAFLFGNHLSAGPFNAELTAIVNNAYNNAVAANERAVTAAAQADLATTNGAAQVALATTQAGNAATSAATAATQAGNASTSASGAATSAGTATAQAATATTQAGIATTKAGEAATSAAAAASSAASISSGPVTSVNGKTGVAVLNAADVGAASLAANTYTGAQELATGASIAGAATINLNTATGNRVHITGAGWNCAAVTLTRGPRTVIFDGIGTLTHHATNNNLPGVANIATAAGDRAIYESDGATVYCVAYTRVDGTPVTSSGGGNHRIHLVTGNGHGSTNTKIRRYTTAQVNTGSALTYADSATSGMSITVNATGIYSCHCQDSVNAATQSYFGISVNSAQLTTSIQSITAADAKAIGVTIPSRTGFFSTALALTAGDVLRVHTDGSVDGASVAFSWFSIAKVGNV